MEFKDSEIFDLVTFRLFNKADYSKLDESQKEQVKLEILRSKLTELK